MHKSRQTVSRPLLPKAESFQSRLARFPMTRMRVATMALDEISY
jgi:hypothetical protein